MLFVIVTNTKEKRGMIVLLQKLNVGESNKDAFMVKRKM